MLAVSVLLVAFLSTHPRPHALVLDWMLSVPLGLTLAVGIVCMAAGVRRIRRGLAAMDRLRSDLTAIRRGERVRLDSALPAEVQPLADTLDDLLADRESRVTRAVARAGDLAHGLKTPLAVLAADAAQAHAAGHHAIGDSIESQVRRMQRHIHSHLAHARAAASAGRSDVRAAVEPAVEALLRTMRRIHADRGLTLRASASEAHVVVCRQEDLEEMLGNLVDNACKWAKAQVLISASTSHGQVILVVDDDGDGVEEEERARVLERGVRADEEAPGSGLGLAITRDLAELYGGSLDLGAAPLGGLRAALRLPSHDHQAG